MGGARQTTAASSKVDHSAPASKSTVGSMSGGGVGCDIRYHESGGEVHFHDDATPLKVAIPVAEYWELWDGFVNGTIPQISFLDIVNNTSLLITRQDEYVAGGASESDILIEVKPMNMAKTFLDMHTFVRGA